MINIFNKLFSKLFKGKVKEIPYIQPPLKKKNKLSKFQNLKSQLYFIKLKHKRHIRDIAYRSKRNNLRMA